MARGRQQRATANSRSAIGDQGDDEEGLAALDQQIMLHRHEPEEDPFAQWQRQAAAHMLKDLERTAVDEDLEALRAGWATGFSASASRRAHTLGPDFLSEDMLEAPTRPTELNRRGDTAMRRLQAVHQLRQLAGPESGSPHGGRGLAPISGGFVSRRGSANALMLGGPTHSGGTQRWRGPLDAESEDSSEDEIQALALRCSPQPRQRPAPVARSRTWQAGRHVGHRGEEDPWSSWESRWAEAFRTMDGAARAREQEQRRCEEEERRRLWAEHAEAEWLREEEVRKWRARRAEASAQPASSTRASQTSGGFAARGSSSTSAGGAAGSTGSGAAGGAAGAAQGPKASPSAPPPRRPGPAGAPSPAAAASTTGQPPVPRFASFQAFEEAWGKFEAKVRDQGAISYADVPWPLSLLTVSGVTSADSAPERKKKLRAALLRWHPDKWAPLLGRVKDADKQQVITQVKEVTRKILAEKEQYGW